MRNCLVKIFALLFSFTLGGCYEGWEYPKGALTTPTPSAGPVKNPVAYILFEPIYLGSDSMADPACFPNTGIGTFKSTEWQLRVSSIKAALQGICDTYVENDLSIPDSDCSTLNTIATDATNTAPWGMNAAPTVDPAGRYAVELKAVFWEGDVAAVPPSAVTQTNWAAWTILKSSGVKTLSLHYFVLSNQEQGYFSAWSAALPSSAETNGTPINTVDPSATGMTNRTQTVASDTAALISWIRSKL